MQKLRNAISGCRESLPDLTFIADESLEGLPDAAQVTDMRAVLQALVNDFEDHLKAMQTSLDEGEVNFTNKQTAWKVATQAHETEMETALRGLPATAGKSGQEVGTAYQRLMEEIERIKPLKARVLNHETTRDALKQERRNLLAELSDLRGQRIQELQKAARKLNRRLEGKLKVEIVPEADRSPLVKFLVGCKLEGVAERRLAWIEEVESISSMSRPWLH